MALFGGEDQSLTIVLKLRDELTHALEGVQGKLGGLQSTFRKMSVVGAAMFAAVGYSALTAVKAFESFNLEIERAGAFVNASQQQMQDFRKAAIEAARGTQFSFDQTAAALGNFVGGEISAQEATQNLAK